MLIAEELLLVALDPVKGTVHLGSRDGVTVALTVALAAELALSGRLASDTPTIAPLLGPRPHDELLADALDAIEARTGTKVVDALAKLDKDLGGVWHRVVDRLVIAGALGQERHGLLPTHHPVIDTASRDRAVAALRAAATGDGPLDGRTETLLACAGSCWLLDRVVPERPERRHARERVEAAVAHAPFGSLIKALIDARTPTTI